MKKYLRAMKRLNELNCVAMERELNWNEAKEHVDLSLYAININRKVSLWFFTASLLILVYVKFG